MAKKKTNNPVVKNKKSSAPKKTVEIKSHSNFFLENKSLLIEIFCFFMIGIGLLMALIIYGSKLIFTGIIGKFLNTALIGLWGFGAYIIPVLLISYFCYLLFKREKLFNAYKIISAILLFFMIISFVHILSYKKDLAITGLITYYTKGNISNGGFFGAIIGNFLMSILGKAGSIILLLACSIGLTIFITGKSLIPILNEGVVLLKKLFNTIFAKKETQQPKKEVQQKKEIQTKKETPLKKAVPPKKTVEKRTIETPLRKEPTRFGSSLQKSTDNKPFNFALATDGEVPINTQKVLIYGESDNVKDESPILKAITTPPALRENLNLEKESDFLSEEIEVVHGQVFNDMKKSEEELAIAIQNITEPLIETEPIIKALPVETMIEHTVDEDEYVDEDLDEEFDNIVIQTKVDELSKLQPLEDSIEFKKIPEPTYVYPSIDLLLTNPATSSSDSREEVIANAKKLEETLKSFGVEAKVVEISKGPTVTRYELSPSQGVKVSKIVNLADDLALNLAAAGIRIEAPIPGKAAVGIEVPNKETQAVFLREVISEDSFSNFPSKLAFGVGKDITGNVVVTDLGKMPHMLIAGSTGSGKSVCINTIITSLLYKSNPDEVKLLMIDPKVVELSVYNGIPHLLIPVVTDPKKAASALNWAVQEMIKRYNLFAETSVRDLKGYNAHLVETGEGQPLPQIVIIIDELADLMMAAPGEVEDAICRLAQMARAAGLHLIIATQRPSVDVITGVIKANIPSRIAFAVSSGTDSRTILDMVGAEKLLGKGDMLFYPLGVNKPIRIQGAFISDKEVESIVVFIKKGQNASYDQEMVDRITSSSKFQESGGDEEDEFLQQAVELVVEKEKASVSMLQRQFRIGYNRAARLMEDLESRGIVGPEDGSKPRKVLMTYEELQDFRER